MRALLSGLAVKLHFYNFQWDIDTSFKITKYNKHECTEYYN